MKIAYKFLSILLLSALPVLANSQDLDECALLEDKQSAPQSWSEYADEMLDEIGIEHAAVWNDALASLMDLEGWQDWWNQPGIDWTAIDIQVLSDAKRVLKDTAYAAINVDGWIQLKDYIENLSLEDIQAMPEQAMSAITAMNKWIEQLWNEPITEIMEILPLIFLHEAKILTYRSSGMRNAVSSITPVTSSAITNFLIRFLTQLTARRTAQNAIYHIWNEYVPGMENITPEVKDKLDTILKVLEDDYGINEKLVYSSAALVASICTTLISQTIIRTHRNINRAALMPGPQVHLNGAHPDAP